MMPKSAYVLLLLVICGTQHAMEGQCYNYDKLTVGELGTGNDNAPTMEELIFWQQLQLKRWQQQQIEKSLKKPCHYFDYRGLNSNSKGESLGYCMVEGVYCLERNKIGRYVENDRPSVRENMILRMPWPPVILPHEMRHDAQNSEFMTAFKTSPYEGVPASLGDLDPMVGQENGTH